MQTGKKNKFAIWAITNNGACIADKIAKGLEGSELYFHHELNNGNAFSFRTLKSILPKVFNNYKGHIFIMSTGIVVRAIALLLKSKTTDPAVVVMDDMGIHSISLVSGHIGGANELAIKVAKLTGAKPVITTATDLNNIPGIDLIAGKLNLFIENPDAIKIISMALLSGKKVKVHDPYEILKRHFPSRFIEKPPGSDFMSGNKPGVFVDDIVTELPPNILILRPPTLVAGIGCNRNTGKEEIKSFLSNTLENNNLSQKSLARIATINIKSDEPGLIALGNDLGLPIVFFDKEELTKATGIKSQSDIVEKYTGVKNVCEAAAILASKNGQLVIPKNSIKNVTVAIARTSFIS